MKTFREHPRCGGSLANAEHKEKRCAAQTDRPDISAHQSCWVCWTVPRRPNPWCASSVIRCEALQHNVAHKKFTCVNNCSEAHIVAAPCVRWTHSKKDALLAISLIHSSDTNRRNTKSEHMCSEF